MKYIFLFFFLVSSTSAFAVDDVPIRQSEQEDLDKSQASPSKEPSLQESPGYTNKASSSELEDEGEINASEFSPYLSKRERSDSFKAFWKAAFNPKAFYGGNTTGAIIVMEIYGKISWELIESLSVHSQGLIVGRSGFTQFVHDRQDRPSGSYLQEGFFKWRPYSYFSLKTGIIEQSFLEAPLLITDKAFPSFQGELFLNDFFSSSKLSVLLQVAMPTNTIEELQRRYQFVRGYPLFLSHSIFFTSSDFFLGGDIKEKLTLFSYYNLPPAVAAWSRIHGNDVPPRIKSDSTFKYSYVGLHNHLSWKLNFSELWISEIGMDFLYNFGAPQKKNQGTRLYSAVYHNYKDFMEIRVVGEMFANQSDSSVAYYNSETYGHNNRLGFLVKAQGHFYNSSLTAGVSFTNSWPINYSKESPIGYSMSFSVFLMTNYIAI